MGFGKITRYFFKRLFVSIPVFIGITCISFFIINLAPGDPLNSGADPNQSYEDSLQIRKNLGLEDPLYKQYGEWLMHAAKGDLGYSFTTTKPVTTLIAERLPATLILSVSSLILILAITFPLGLLSGAKKDSVFDIGVLVITFLGLSIPTFWLGLMLILLFSLELDILPTSGFMDPTLVDASFFAQAISVGQHLTLPLLTILIGGLAGLTRYHRFSIISILNKTYITAARSRSISEGKILFVHAFKNACLPVITILGLSLPGLIGGSFVIEYIFSWPGMGQLGIKSIFARDYPVLMGTICFSSLLIIIGNLIADICYSLVDPRIQLK